MILALDFWRAAGLLRALLSCAARSATVSARRFLP
jgi:hypothetical protein